jgi:hypothetical protein
MITRVVIPSLAKEMQVARRAHETVDDPVKGVSKIVLGDGMRNAVSATRLFAFDGRACHFDVMLDIMDRVNTFVPRKH